MIDVNQKFIIVIIIYLLLAACGPPIPIPIPALPSDVSYVTEDFVQTMVEDSFSRKRVIDNFGRPLRYRENEVNYKICRKKGEILILFPLTAEISDRSYEYSELVLKFDSQDILRGYIKIPLQAPPDRYAEDMNLRKQGKGGDDIAGMLWRTSETYLTSQQKDIVEEREMNDRYYLMRKREIASEVRKKAEAGDPKAQFELYMLEDKTSPKWLCRSADQGYIDAEMWLGYVLETGSYGFSLDNMQSYVWYQRAALGAHQQEVKKNIHKIKDESPKYYFGKGTSCDIAQKIVDLEGKLGSEGVYKAESMLERWMPGNCERQYEKPKPDSIN